MDQNPYESPRSDKPLAPADKIKRGIGVGVILLLTPIAVVIAILRSCTAANYAANIPGEVGAGITLGYLVAFVPPIIVLIAMGLWALCAFIIDR
jgi:hypothetical protein